MKTHKNGRFAVGHSVSKNHPFYQRNNALHVKGDDIVDPERVEIDYTPDERTWYEEILDI